MFAYLFNARNARALPAQVTVEGYVSVTGTVVTLPGWTHDRGHSDPVRVVNIADVTLPCEDCGYGVGTRIATDGDWFVCRECVPFYGHTRPLDSDSVTARINAEAERMRCTITGQTDCAQRDCELHYMSAPLKLACNGGIACDPALSDRCLCG